MPRGEFCEETELVEVCGQPVHSRRLCSAHCSYRRRNGMPLPPKLPREPSWVPEVRYVYGDLLCLAIEDDCGEYLRMPPSPSEVRKGICGQYAARVRCLPCGKEYLIQCSNLKRGAQRCKVCTLLRRNAAKTTEQYRAMGQARQALLTIEQQRERGRSIQAGRTFEQRSASAMKIPPERRRERARVANAGMTAAQRSEMARRVLTREVCQRAGRGRHALFTTDEQRRDFARAVSLAMTTEQRGALNQEINAALWGTPENREKMLAAFGERSARQREYSRRNMWNEVLDALEKVGYPVPPEVDN